MSRARPAPDPSAGAASPGARRARRAARAGALACLAFVSRANAQPAPAAAALFERGVEAMKRGQFAEACPPLAESFRLDPLPGTAFTLAECEAYAGGVASAWLHYREYLRIYARLPAEQRARQGERERLAREQEAALGARVPHLRLHRAGPAPPGASLRLDGAPLGEASWGLPLPLDPGAHELSAEAPAAAPSVTRFDLVEGRDHTIAVTWPRPPAPDAPPGARPAIGAAAAARPPGTRRALLYGAAGVGAAGLAAGGVAGVLALNRQAIADERCRDGACVDRAGERAGEQAYDYATWSTVGFAVGAGALLGAALLWLTEPSAPSRARARWAPVVAPGPAPAVGVAGAW